MDKAKTLPRTKRDKSPSPSSSSFSSLKTATVGKINSFRGLKKNTPLMRKKKKKKDDDTPVPETAPLNDTPELPETPIGPPEASSTPSLDSIKPTQPMLKTPKKPKPPIKKLVKGGKGLLHKFKGKNESAPIMVDTTLDVRRSAPKKEDAIGGEPQHQSIAEELENGDIGAELTTVTSKDEWSTTATCEKVRKLSRLEIQQSVYNEEVDGEGEGLSDSAIPEDEAFAEDESASEPVTVNGHTQPSISIDKKSPSTIKKEILSAVNSAKIRKTSDPISNGSRSTKPRKVSMQARSPSDKNEFLFKILVIGELGTGKTSIIKRYVHQFFSQHYRATIGVDFALKVLPWNSETTIRLQLWDIAGQERFGNMTRVYYKEAVGAFIVFDVTRVSTFEAVTKWKQDLDAKVQLADGEPIPCVLLANKCDQPKEGLVNNASKMDEFCKENQFVSWFETSARDNINIDEAANSLVAKIVQNNQKKREVVEANNGAGVINIDNTDGSEPTPKRKFCNAC